MENGQRKLIALINYAHDLKELKGNLKNWESFSAGGPSSLRSGFTSNFASKEWTSVCIDEAVHKSKGTSDLAFLAALQEKVSKEPLLEQLAQDVVMEAHAHFWEVMRQCLPKLYSRAHNIKRKAMHYYIEAEANDQDQKRRALLRSSWIDEIKLAQNSG